MLESLFLTVLLHALSLAQANNVTGIQTRIHAAFVITREGESVPILEDRLNAYNAPTTPLGALQMTRAGNFFRQRFLQRDNASTSTDAMNRIAGISENTINNDELLIVTRERQHSMASAEAFMQGLYPQQMSLNSSAMLPANELGSETWAMAGYQYPAISSVGLLNPESVFLEGTSGCSNFQQFRTQYERSDKLANLVDSTRVFLENVGRWSGMRDKLSRPDRNYNRAYEMWDWVQFKSRYDQGITNASISNDEGIRMRALASEHEWDLYGNTSSYISTVAGRTLAASVLGVFQSKINPPIPNTDYPIKLALLFTSHRPFLSFAALSSLATADDDFLGLPVQGASMVFELYSNGSPDNATLPSDPSELFVNFYFHNGTTASQDYARYSPFTQSSPGHSSMRWTDFEREMAAIMIASTDAWCETCASSMPFCDAYMQSQRVQAESRRLSPVVAGVIGAVILLALMITIAVLAFAVGGVRLSRNGKKGDGQARRWYGWGRGEKKSALGGFKGNAKLGSDTDLVFGKTAPIGSKVREVQEEEQDGAVKPRVGSWELKKQERKDDEVEQGNGNGNGLSFERTHAREDPDEIWMETGNMRPTVPRQF